MLLLFSVLPIAAVRLLLRSQPTKYIQRLPIPLLGFSPFLPLSSPLCLALVRSLPLSLSVPIALTAAAAATTGLRLPAGLSRMANPDQYGPPCHGGGGLP